MQGEALDVHTRKWQHRLLPYMSIALAVLALTYLVGSFLQLDALRRHIVAMPSLSQSDILRPYDCPVAWPAETCLAIRTADTAAVMEANLVARRYHQSAALLMGAVWSRYLGFLTGMVLSLVGATFILGKLGTSENTLNP
jgi:hypothetical protein